MEYKKKKLFEAYQMLLSFFHRRNIENYSPRRERERETARSVFRHIPHFCLWKRPRFCSSEFMRAPHLCTLTLVTCWQQQQRERNMFLPVHSNNVKEICLFYRYTLQQQQQRESNVSVSTCTHWLTDSSNNVKEICLFLPTHTVDKQQECERNAFVSTCTHRLTSSNKNVKETCLFLPVRTGWLAPIRTWKKCVCFYLYTLVV